MIPRLLKIKGLYSYKETQIVDFNKLIDAGVFGIFGEVGSGKSTILEAMIFCIYDKTERLKSNEDRYYNMMNLGMNEGEIDFTFIAGPQNEEYKIYIKFVRNKKDFTKVQKDTAHYYRIQNGVQIPIEQKEILDAVGLTYENFKMTVIIPQGKFREFIELSNSERSKMLKELFRLHQFDLSDKVKVLDYRNNTLLNQKTGEISAYQFEDDNVLKEKENTLQNIIHELQEITKQIDILDKDVSANNELKQSLEEIQKFQSELQELSKATASIQSKEKELEEYLNIRNEFRSLYEAEYRTEKSLDELRDKKKALDKELDEIVASLQQLQHDADVKTKRFNEIEELKLKAVEFEKVAEYIEKKKKQEGHQKELNEIHQRLENLKKENTDLEVLKKENEKHIQALKELLLPEKIIFELNQWFKDKEKAEEEINDVEQKLHNSQLKMSEWLTEFKQIISGLDVINETMQEDEIDEYFRKRKELNDETIKDLFANKNALNIKIELSRHADMLAEGKPCLLCGSVHHPLPLQNNISRDEMDILENKINKIQHAIASDTKSNRDINTKLVEKKQIVKEIASFQTELEKKKENYNSHFQIQPHASYSIEGKNDFEVRINKQIENQNKIANLENAVKTYIEKIENIKLQEISEGNHDVRCNTILDNLQLEIEKLKNEIVILDINDFLSEEVTTLRTKKDSILNSIALIQQEYENANRLLSSKELEKAQKTGSIESVNGTIKDVSEELKTAKNKIQEKLDEKKIEHSKMKEVLMKKLNEKEITDLINEHKSKVTQKETAINVLSGKVKGKHFDPVQFSIQEKNLHDFKQKQKGVLESKGGLEMEIAQSKINLQKKKDLQVEIDALITRKTDIDKLKTMFMGNGFVDFVAQRYLSNVVAVANKRFKKMVRQKYSLELKDGDIIIRDHMNEGKERSIKSLSGGQTFQAALSLALSLSENIQRNAGVDQHFFFLDEGFGSLDEDNLQIVFETLRTLQQENRIVGLISHVKALQQELDIHLMITNDEKSGSRISKSWEN